MTHDEYVNQLKDYVKGEIVAEAYSQVISKFAFLAWGPLGPFVKFIISKIAAILVEKTELKIFFTYTDFRVSRQGTKVHEAIENIIAARKNGGDYDIKKAENDLKNSFRELVRLSN